MRNYPLVVFTIAAVLFGSGIGRDAFLIWQGPFSDPACVGGTALVMGAAQYDGEPSPALTRRLDRAVELYRQGCVERIVVSGGSKAGDRFSEGEAGIRYLLKHAVPHTVLNAETTASTSMQNLVHSRSLVAGDRLVVVTDDLHAHRTQWLADRLGIEADVASVEVRSGRLNYALRELFILFVYQLGFVR